MHWEGERCLQGFGWEAWRITLRWTLGIDGANWIQLVQDRVQWQAFVNTIMNLWVP